MKYTRSKILFLLAFWIGLLPEITKVQNMKRKLSPKCVRASKKALQKTEKHLKIGNVRGRAGHYSAAYFTYLTKIMREIFKLVYFCSQFGGI